MKAGDKLPQVTFQTRVRDEAVGGPNPFRWEAVTTDDYFKGKRVVLVDDVLATGGTLVAATELIERAGGSVVGYAVVLEVDGLGGRDRLGDAPLVVLEHNN